MKQKSPHILNASSNLLGFCLIIITSIKITKTASGTSLDECASIASICLAISCFFSFLAIRTANTKSEIKYEKIADYLFVISLTTIVISVILLILNIF